MLDKINQFISLFIETFKMFGRGKLWLVLLIITIANGLVLIAHQEFLFGLFYPLISWWTSWVNVIAGNIFTHYPGHYLTLPYYYGLARLLPAFLLEGLVLGWAAMIFRKGYTKGANLPTNFGYIGKKWFHLTGCWVIINGLAMLVSIYLPDMLETMHENSFRRLLLVEFVIIPTAISIILGMFYYTMASVAIEGRSLLGAIKRSLTLFIRRPLTSICLAGVVLAGPYVLTALASKSNSIIDKFHPELVFWILLAGLAAELIANFLWMGTAVRFLLEESHE